MMKRRIIIIGVIIVAAIAGVFIPGRHTDKQKTSGISQSAKDLYYCPMHPNAKPSQQPASLEDETLRDPVLA